MNTGKLYIVATPIGNLGDFTFRAVETLKRVDIVLCEDTRVTYTLLKHYDIDTQTMSYHQHSDDEKVEKIRELLDDGNDIALVTDAGTPGISDPGNKLIHDLRSTIEELEIIPIPGASAVVAALSVSGFPTDKFIFMGFPPHKKGRQTYFKNLAEKEYTVAIYESCHRIKKTLVNLSDVLDPDMKICICRELTKKFETIYRGTIAEMMKLDLKEKGEFVVVISK